MANILTVTTRQVANLGIILTEVESVSVSLIVSNPGPYSSVVLDAEVKVTDQKMAFERTTGRSVNMYMLCECNVNVV